jgi:menaquinone-dependent protoporphyrinogen IX oxidase
MEKALDEKFLEISKGNAYFGGSLDYDNMNFLERSIINKVAKKSDFHTGMHEETIAKFASTINGEAS